MPSIKVFYYGLFMDPDLLKQQGLNPDKHVIARLDNFQLLLGERATMIPMLGSEVWGTVMSLNEQEIKKLYSPPSVADYKPLKIECYTENGDKLNASTYILPEGYPLSPPKNADYAKKLLTICKKLNIPPFYCNHISAMVRAIENKGKAEK
ncbi:MAG: gamma-glutamylcyclotransferase [Kordiimonadaceae bacterium]|nr:gamma-glutamylcyclotransferase [Kordiimonadaceae bacterium]